MAVASENISLVLGDFLTTCPSQVEEGSIDIVVTSPPYNSGKKYERCCGATVH